MVVCLRVETTIFQLLGRLWKPRATETLWGALAWFAGIRRRRRQIGTDLACRNSAMEASSRHQLGQEFDGGSAKLSCRNSTAEAANRH